jgi:hypothetical protein
MTSAGDALRREADRALRAGDVTLAAELYSVAGDVAADELRRMSRAELEQLEPELLSGCCCEAAT